MRALRPGLWLVVFLLLVGCDGRATPTLSPQLPSVTATRTRRPPTSTPVPTATPVLPLVVLDDALPVALHRQMQESGLRLVKAEEGQVLRFGMVSEEAPWAVGWVYALVAPFGTLADECELSLLQAVWQGQPPEGGVLQDLYLSPETMAVWKQAWGEPEALHVHVVADSALLSTVWEQPRAWAILPFEQLQPRWKVIRLAGRSPLDWEFDPDAYALTAHFGMSGDAVMLAALPASPPLLSNRDAQRLTVVVMTGTTAMVRHTAEKMELKGLDYPYTLIQPWLEQGDFLHISNEAVFYSECPPAVPFRTRAQFCSAPGYFAVLEALGVDIVELTGNHLLDWGGPALQETLARYEENGLLTYGGGENLDAARAVLKIEHHGNRLAFLGCNAIGPQTVYATRNSPGAAPCDLMGLEKTVRQLRREGYLPIVTFQHLEVESNQAPSALRTDFRQMGWAGAVIVSGSQAHVPHGFGFVVAEDWTPEGFLSYGLGNLFFDQMFPLARPGLIERHIFYDGRYLGNEILVTMLEDSAQRRPATLEERQKLLDILFAESDLKLP